MSVNSTSGKCFYDFFSDHGGFLGCDTLKIEAVRFSETLVPGYESTGCHNLEDRQEQIRCGELEIDLNHFHPLV